MNNDKPAAIVENGYNQIAQVYHNQRDKFKNDDLLSSFAALLPPGGELLDAGCGAGVPVARFLVEAGFRVTGVDISRSMLELARLNVPEARFMKMDMRRLAFEDFRFDGIAAFYSLFHVPRNEQPQVLTSFHRLLRQDGILLFCSGVSTWEGIANFFGAQMYWSHPDREKTRNHVIDAGFSVILSEVREYGGERHCWVMARKTHNQSLVGPPS